MGLFGKHKDSEAKEELPPLKFPELPPEKEEKTGISKQDEQAIKQAVKPAQPAAQPSMPMQEEEKPLFVKIDKYREVISTVNEIKGKLKDAGDVLAELNNIKEQEDKEINAWHTDIESIKQKLMSVDKALFEL